MNLQTSQQGFIKLILLIVIGLVALGYFGFNLRDILAAPIVQENLAYGWELAKTIWVNWLQAPAMWLFENVIKFLWDLFLEGLGKLKAN